MLCSALRFAGLPFALNLLCVSPLVLAEHIKKKIKEKAEEKGRHGERDQIKPQVQQGTRVAV